MSPDFVVHTGDALTVLRTLPAESVHCCITSPPYYGLRDYGTAEWTSVAITCDHIAKRKPPVIGSSSTLGFPADGGPRRIAEGNQYHNAYTEQFQFVCAKCGAQRTDKQIGREDTAEQYIEQLVEVFQEVRRVLKDDGTLWLTIGDSYCASGGNTKGASSDGAVGRAWNGLNSKGGVGIKPKDLIGIPWLLAFALRADGWYLRSEIIWHKPNPMPESVKDRPTKAHEQIFLLSKSATYYYDSNAIKEDATGRSSGNKAKSWGNNETAVRNDGRGDVETLRGIPWDGQTKRNKRSVWTIAPKPFKGAHFAVFPPEIPKTCLLAGSPKGGTVLDPFSGAGTTGIVAAKNGRSYIGIELNPEYVALSNDRYAALAAA